jgi:predicted nicotinamide N-methyase
MGGGLPDGRPRPGQFRPAVTEFDEEERRRAFIIANCGVQSPPHVPEIRLYLADDAHALWHKTETELDAVGLEPPFWAFAWAGGQALARYLFDNPEIVGGRNALDAASGSGLVAISARRAGANRVLANDTDPFAAAAVALNSGLNDAEIAFDPRDLTTLPAPHSKLADVILAGDVFYDPAMSKAFFAWLAAQHSLGAEILIGDPGRSYLPRAALREIAVYELTTSRALEDAAVKRTTVWQFCG